MGRSLWPIQYTIQMKVTCQALCLVRPATNQDPRRTTEAPFGVLWRWERTSACGCPPEAHMVATATKICSQVGPRTVLCHTSKWHWQTHTFLETFGVLAVLLDQTHVFDCDVYPAQDRRSVCYWNQCSSCPTSFLHAL